MPFYVKQGEIPKKRHSVFKKKDGSLHYEELMGRHGFAHHSTNMYHLHMPTRVQAVGPTTAAVPKPIDGAHRHRHIKTFELSASGDPIAARNLLLFNRDLKISKVHASTAMDFFFRNGHHDEIHYMQEGGGVLHCQLGDLRFEKGDYLVIPRGIIYKLVFDGGEGRSLLIESAGLVATPQRYRSPHGQLLEHAPFCERDIRTPQLQKPVDQEGSFTVKTRLDWGLQEFTYDRHPFDVVGWDGFHFPWALNINEFEPIVGSIHQPPPVHQTFEANGFVVCSFVSRPFDFHPDAIPAPYPHSNLDTDEVLFYSMGNFMSRKGISAESISYHPVGLAHGPHPGRYEGSVGKKATEELAVMIDTFAPLHVAQAADDVDDPDYPLSWVK
jgi:homogentisate 1,2-dioxygenase